MAILKCKMCGGDIELSADKTFGTCEYCGSTMTFPKVDDEQRAAMFNRGNHFRRIGEFDKALAVYERIVQEDENDAEAHWCCALCRFGIEYVEDPNTFEYLPTCHRASFDSFLEDVDYLAALEHSDGVTRRQYQKDAAKIAEVQRGILATSQNEEPFDVFLCYKETEDDGSRTRDSLYAQDIYYQLMEQGRRVFFSRITLEDKAGTEYEPYIFAALNSAKVMVLVTTSAEHANAVWVKNEWSRFLSLMRKDRTKLLLPCYRDMDPYDLPEALSVLQSYDMGKIGFIQDLIRGVNKVLNAAKPKAQTVKETVVVQPATNPAVTPLLKRAFLFLEDGDWQSADEYCEKVLDMDPENGEAYLGKLMTELRVRKREGLKDQPQPFENQSNYAKAMRFGNDKLRQELTGVSAYIKDRNETARQKGVYQQALAIMSERSEQGYRKAAELFASVPDYGDARAKVDECIEKAKRTRQDGVYQQASALMREDTEPSCRKAAELFASISDYSDAAKQREKCLQRAETIRQDGIYQQALAAMKERSAQGYQKATALLSSISDYKDARQKISDCAAEAEDLRQEQIYQKATDLARQDTEESCRKAAELFASIPAYRDAQDKSFKYREKAESIRKEQVYRNAVKLASYRTVHELTQALEQFRSIPGHKDADLQIDTCQRKLAELQLREENRRRKQERQEEMDALSGKPKPGKKIVLPLLLTVAALAAIAVAFLMVILPMLRYSKANELYTDGKYEEAIAVFEKLGDYKDSQMRLETCQKDLNYAQAVASYNDQKYEEAISAFASLNGYKDSADLLWASAVQLHQQRERDRYDAATKLFQTGRYEEAIAAFTALDGYKDSAAQIEACNTAIMDRAYSTAVALYETGKYKEAIAAFTALDGYKDSATQITKCETAIKDQKYNAAISLIENGKYVEAYEALIDLNGYKDSAAKAKEIYGQYKAEKLKTAKVGDYVVFGSYEQDNNTSNGKEAIEWIVLAKEGNRALLISRFALDCQRYNSNSANVTWETSSLRKWLNGTFISNAFSSDEQNMIQTTTVTADKNPSYNTSPGNNTTDKVFLLSITEVYKYFSSNSARQCKGTDYCYAQGAYKGNNGNCWWWLRSPGYNSNYAAFVLYDGSVIDYGLGVDDVSDAVRPALWINLGS